MKWADIIRCSSQGSLDPDHTVNKTEEAWRNELTDEQFRVTRLKGTEKPFDSEMCQLFEPGIYACICCNALLFNAEEKFDSGTGWPSFTQPIKENAIAYNTDSTLVAIRVECVCNSCGAHLGHVFQDGPKPSGLRYCVNAVSLNKVDVSTEKATLGGGCFWCADALFSSIAGVVKVESGYSDGDLRDPTYEQVCTGKTGHAEVIQITFNPNEISYANLVKIHFKTHNPTTLNQQGADKGTQYRSIILTHNEKQQSIVKNLLTEISADFNQPIVTIIKPFKTFYKAEDHHQGYFQNNSENRYCQAVITPKLDNLKQLLKGGI